MKKGMKIKLSDTEAQAKKIAEQLQGGEILALIGELGSGKTTFTQFLGKQLSIKRIITSPTFLVMQQYNGLTRTSGNKITLYHLDLYRTDSFTEVEQLGITERWGQKDTITIIEWADKISEFLPENTYKLFLYR